MPKQLRRLVEQSVRNEAILTALAGKMGVDVSEVDYNAARLSWNKRMGDELSIKAMTEEPMIDTLLTPGTTIPADASIGSAAVHRANYERTVDPTGAIVAAPADPSKVIIPADTTTPGITDAEESGAETPPPAPTTAAKK